MKAISASIWVLTVLGLTSHLALAQGGIVWTTGLSLARLKQKAKQDNTFIFLDVFATWCGPCKQMDKYVYPNDTVGKFMNDKFLSVKVQTDRTGGDSEEVKRWYADAQAIVKAYHITGYPTYIFLSPDGKLVHKSAGFQPIEQFVGQAATALKPGQVYTDPYLEYTQLRADYDAGKKNYQRINYMIKCANELNDPRFAEQLTAEYTRYLEQAPLKDVYTKTAMDFLSNIEVKSSSKLFSLFYPNGKKADAAAGVKGFSERMIHRVVVREYVYPFLKLKPVQMPVRADGKAVGPVDTSDANWALLHKQIKEKYDKGYADRGVLNGKISWYEQKQNFPAYYAAYFDKLERYGIDTLFASNFETYYKINENCWGVFQRLNDKTMLQKASYWMEQVIQKHPKTSAFIDTYANVLYKAGEKEKAIQWEEKALLLATNKKRQMDIEGFADVLKKMKAGQATW